MLPCPARKIGRQLHFLRCFKEQFPRSSTSLSSMFTLHFMLVPNNAACSKKHMQAQLLQNDYTKSNTKHIITLYLDHCVTSYFEMKYRIRIVEHLLLTGHAIKIVRNITTKEQLCKNHKTANLQLIIIPASKDDDDKYLRSVLVSNHLLWHHMISFCDRLANNLQTTKSLNL